METDDPLKVVTSEQSRLTVDRRLSTCCELLKSIVEDNATDEEIILSRVTLRALEAIVRFYDYHNFVSPAVIEKPLKKDFRSTLMESNRGADLEFTEGLINDLPYLGELLTAADYLDAKSYLSLLCAYVASFFMNKEWDQIKDEFNLEGDFGYPEKEELKEEYPWLNEQSKDS
mmetsp:Transcript_22590/g.40660  ORF Transcript_22590/g.40660 Transcript_22590/m.40660 type:complete len:173 (+) Transcript_22590:10-528(+)